MGGFYFYNPYDNCDQLFTPVNQNNIGILARSLRDRLPLREELEDRGTQRVLTTVFVVAQVSWFITQCISRGAASIHITKLELITVGYIVICAVLQFSWREKPHNVTQPIRVEMKFNSQPFFDPDDVRVIYEDS
jgi:hypothetical protein